MTEDLQTLLEKIQRDGVDKAQADAAAIIAKAQAQAHDIVESAKNEASKCLAEAETSAKAFETRASETIRQAARDTVMNVEQSVTNMLTALLVTDVNTALSDPATVAPLAVEAVRAVISDQPIAVATTEKLADALRAAFAKNATTNVTIVTDPTVGSGFSIRLDHGRVEHAFTGAVIAETLAKRLRPRLAALMNHA